MIKDSQKVMLLAFPLKLVYSNSLQRLTCGPYDYDGTISCTSHTTINKRCRQNRLRLYFKFRCRRSILVRSEHFRGLEFGGVVQAPGSTRFETRSEESL